MILTDAGNSLKSLFIARKVGTFRRLVMEKKIVTPVILLLLVFAGGVIAQDTGVIVPANDFRVNVRTNSNVYHNANVLSLTVELLNDSPGHIRLSPLEGPVRNTDAIEVTGGILDDEAVDIAVRPVCPAIIGYARLTPMDFTIYTMDASFAPEIAYPLPLFGSPVVNPHSTRIISTAKILIGCPVPVPVDAEPALSDVEKVSATADRPEIDVVGKYYAIRPGRYLLEVNINSIGGVKLAQAQKVVIIKPRKTSPTIKLLRDNNARIRKNIKLSQESYQAILKNYKYAIYNNRYIRMIYRILSGSTTTDRTNSTILQAPTGPNIK